MERRASATTLCSFLKRYDKSFAELGEDVKNQISHRARAVAKLAAYLKG